MYLNMARQAHTCQDDAPLNTCFGEARRGRPLPSVPNSCGRCWTPSTDVSRCRVFSPLVSRKKRGVPSSTRIILITLTRGVVLRSRPQYKHTGSILFSAMLRPRRGVFQHFILVSLGRNGLRVCFRRDLFVKVYTSVLPLRLYGYGRSFVEFTSAKSEESRQELRGTRGV